MIVRVPLVRDFFLVAVRKADHFFFYFTFAGTGTVGPDILQSRHGRQALQVLVHIYTALYQVSRSLCIDSSIRSRLGCKKFLTITRPFSSFVLYWGSQMIFSTHCTTIHMSHFPQQLGAARKINFLEQWKGEKRWRSTATACSFRLLYCDIIKASGFVLGTGVAGGGYAIWS